MNKKVYIVALKLINSNKMDKNKALTVAAIVFAVVALAHLLRAVLGWQVNIGNFSIPVYFSYIAFIIFAFLSCFVWYVYIFCQISHALLMIQ